MVGDDPIGMLQASLDRGATSAADAEIDLSAFARIQVP